ncbi:hypothetical protein [Actinoplanes solisilvae]|uniref:hypothetical protein n=1 Tax=Actinoplanes solisilvae TaxID=2486853 RepID=UPI000FD9105C|nr:hypothetical protein [Actinoplanes solisilvae]
MRTLLAGTLAGVTTIALLGGCAAKEIQALEPKLELRNAAQQLADAKQAGFTLKLSGSVDDLIAAAKADDPSFKADDEKIMKQIFNSSITMAYDKAGDGAEDDMSSLSATVDGVTGTEIRFVGGLLYAKAPVSELAKKFGASDKDLKEMTGGGGANPGFDAFFGGKWVSLDTKQLTEMAEQGTGTGTTPAEQQKALAELTTSATNLLEGADVVRDSADDKHLIVTSSTAKAAAEGQRLVKAINPALAGELPTEQPKDRPVVLDLWLDNGKLTAAEINVLQFVDGAKGRVAARIEVTDGAKITAPEGATKIDLSGLAPLLAEAGGGKGVGA